MTNDIAGAARREVAAPAKASRARQHPDRKEIHMNPDHTLCVHGLRSIDAFEIPLDGLVFLRGGHGVGKSTLAGAIGTALTGRNRWTDKAGKGIDRQIAHNHEEARLEVEIGERKIIRAIEHGGSELRVSGFRGNSTVQARALLTELGTTRDALEVACDTHVILEASGKEQADILYAALSPRLEFDELLDHVTKGDVKRDDAEKLLREAVDAGIISFPMGTAEMESLYKFLYETRKDANRELEEARKNAEPNANIANRVDPRCLPKLRQELSSTEQKAREVRAEIAKLRAAEEARQTLASLGDASRCDAPRCDAPRSVEEHENQIQLATNAHYKLSHELHEARDAAEALRRAIPEVEEHAPDNGWSGVTAIADSNDAHLHRIAAVVTKNTHADLAKSVEALANNGNALRSLAKEHGGAISEKDREELAETRRKAVAVWEKAQAKVTSLERQEKGASEMRDRLYQERESAVRREALLKKFSGASIERLPALLEEEKTLDAALTAMRQKISEAEISERLGREHEKAVARVRDLKARAELLNTMVESLHPAARTVLLESKAGPVLKRLQSAFHALTGGKYALAITFNPFEVAIRKQCAAKPVPLASLSESERFRTAVMLQDVVASLGKAPFLVVDGADILLPEEFASLIRYLESRRTRYQAIVVTGAIQQNDPRFQTIGAAWKKIEIEIVAARAMAA